MFVTTFLTPIIEKGPHKVVWCPKSRDHNKWVIFHGCKKCQFFEGYANARIGKDNQVISGDVKCSGKINRPNSPWDV